MELKQQGRFTFPLTVDRALLGKLAALFDEVNAVNRAAILAREGVTEADINGPEPGWEDARGRGIRAAKAELSSWPLISVSWNYDDGREFKTNSYASLADSLDSGSGELKSVMISSQALRGTDARITLENDWFESARYSFSGDRALVAHVKSEMDVLLSDARASLPFMHGWIPLLVIFFAFWGLLTLTLVMVQVLAFPYTSGVLRDYAPYIISGAGGFFLPQVAFACVKYYRRAYPRCDFKFGNQDRRTVARRTAIGMITTAIVVPVVLAFLNLT